MILTKTQNLNSKTNVNKSAKICCQIQIGVHFLCGFISRKTQWFVIAQDLAQGNSFEFRAVYMLLERKVLKRALNDDCQTIATNRKSPAYKQKPIPHQLLYMHSAHIHTRRRTELFV